MTYRTIKINDDGTISGKGLDAVKRINYGRTYNVCSPEFGADPTGMKDCTAAIQAAVDKAHAEGGGTVIIPAGEFRVNAKGINLYGYISIRGEGIGSTRIFLDASTVNEFTEENGVFHTGTYNKAVLDKGGYRISIRELSILATMPDGKILRGPDGQYQHIGRDFMQSKMWGITFNTYVGEGPADPDSVHTLKDIEIWDMAGGIAFLGLDDQGCKVSDIRVRRTWKQGMLIGKPDDHPEAWVVSKTDPTKVSRMTGSADNKFHRIDISGGNQSGNGYAGIEIYTAQCMFSQCTSWYHQRYTSGAITGTTDPSGDEKNIWNLKATKEAAVAGQVNLKTNAFRFTKDGAGWYVDGARNEFANCTSQETGGHGWVIVAQACTLDSCRGESMGHEDASKGDAKTGETAGFVITNWAWGTTLRSCIAQNGHARDKGGKVGFYIQDYLERTRIRDAITANLPFKNGVDGAENGVLMPAHPGKEVVIQVNDEFLSTLSRDKTNGSGGAVAPTAAEIIPDELGAIMAHWDFSDASKITASNGRVSAVVLKSGSAPDGTLVQADASKQPWMSALNGRPAIKFKRAESDVLVAPAIGSSPVSTGWSIVMVAAVAVANKLQYLWSSSQSATKPVSITTNNLLAVVGNSGGSTNGYTALSDKDALSLYAPAVITLTATSVGVTVYVNGQKSTVAPAATGAPLDLAGKVTLGSHYAGSDFMDATVGEVVAFSKTLSDSEVAGVSAYLKAKWS